MVVEVRFQDKRSILLEVTGMYDWAAPSCHYVHSQIARQVRQARLTSAHFYFYTYKYREIVCIHTTPHSSLQVMYLRAGGNLGMEGNEWNLTAL